MSVQSEMDSNIIRKPGRPPKYSLEEHAEHRRNYALQYSKTEQARASRRNYQKRLVKKRKPLKIIEKFKENDDLFEAVVTLILSDEKLRYITINKIKDTTLDPSV